MSNLQYNRKEIETVYKGLRNEVTKSTYILTERIGKLLVRTIKRILRDEGYSVRGELINSFVHTITATARGYIVEIGSNSPHAKFVAQGWEAGRWPNVEGIASWITKSGKSFDFSNAPGVDHLAYIIARSIYNRGIRPFNFLDKAMREAEPQIERYIQQLGKNYGVRI